MYNNNEGVEASGVALGKGQAATCLANLDKLRTDNLKTILLLL